MFTLDIPLILQYGGWDEKLWSLVIPDNLRDYTNLLWRDASEKPTEQALLDAEFSASKAWRIAASKDEAQIRIYADYPIWKQANCALGFYDETKTAAIKAGIQAVRTAQEAAETAINVLADVAAVIAFTW